MNIVVQPPTPTDPHSLAEALDSLCVENHAGSPTPGGDADATAAHSDAAPIVGDSSTDTDDDEEFYDSRENLDEAVVAAREGERETEIDPDLRKRIVEQVEFYFSDDNIMKDKFLLKHIWRNKQGYVSIKLLSSFKRVKALTKDWQVVCKALRSSDILEVSESSTKVRRRDPVPKPDKTSAYRSIVVSNFSADPTLDEVRERFSKFGEVTLIRYFRPSLALPGEIKEHQDAHPEFAAGGCVVIEYATPEQSFDACRSVGDDDWRSGLKVVPLVNKKQERAKALLNPSPSPKTRKKNKSSKRLNAHPPDDGHSSSDATAADSSNWRSRSPWNDDGGEYLSSSPGSGWGGGGAMPPRSHSPSPNPSPHGSPQLGGRKRYSPSVSPRTSPVPSSSMKRDFAASRASPLTVGTGSPRSTRVVRNPIGPDESRGFGKRRTLKD